MLAPINSYKKLNDGMRQKIVSEALDYTICYSNMKDNGLIQIILIIENMIEL